MRTSSCRWTGSYHQGRARPSGLKPLWVSTRTLALGAVGSRSYPQAASRNFLDDLKGKSSDLVRRLGMVGYIAKGVVIAGTGVLVSVAASRSEPSKAT